MAIVANDPPNESDPHLYKIFAEAHCTKENLNKLQLLDPQKIDSSSTSEYIVFEDT